MEIFIIKEGIYWWGKSLSLVGNLEELVGKIPTSLLVKNAPVFTFRKNLAKGIARWKTGVKIHHQYENKPPI